MNPTYVECRCRGCAECSRYEKKHLLLRPGPAPAEADPEDAEAEEEAEDMCLTVGTLFHINYSY